MRISTIQAFNNGVVGIQRNYADVTRTQEQISTGNRILTPADDPVASVRLLQLEQQQNILSQYDNNLSAANSSLTQEESTLNSVTNILQRVRELTVQAGNGALSQTDRQAIGSELGERENELLSLMNSRNARGEYLFSGFQGKTPPFARNADGSYTYNGDEGSRKLQIASSLELQINDNGQEVFENAINASRLSLSSVPPAPATALSGMLVEDEVAFANFPAAGIQLDFNDPDPLKYTLTTLPLPGVATAGKLNSTTDTLVHFSGAAFYVNGAPPAGTVFTITGPDANPATPPPNKVGILNTIATLRQVLNSAINTPQGGRDVRDAVAAGLTNLDSNLGIVLQARGQVGARLNIIESTQTDNEDVTLINKSVQADLRELDYAEALSRLSSQTVVLEAAQKSYVKVASLNLFNLL
ncbi:MAG: flagellar hook-associated protein FlgL [Pseudomonadaceae bacterium]|nr:flagellar hook-associated protein FlgL [Pseudomonadaceae bacterium]